MPPPLLEIISLSSQQQLQPSSSSCLKSKPILSVLQTGVIAIIAVALVVVTALVIFAIWHRLGIAKRLKKER